jgi:hypothetical protein
MWHRGQPSKEARARHSCGGGAADGQDRIQVISRHLVGRAGAKRNTTEEEIFLRRICGRAALLHAALESRRGILPVKIAIFLWRA